MTNEFSEALKKNYEFLPDFEKFTQQHNLVFI